MPELPEVETTTRGIREKALGLKIKEVWTDLDTKDKRKHDTVANSKFFAHFKKEVTDKKIISVERMAKNILVHLSGNKTILIHLKMTGHIMYGKYIFKKTQNKWESAEDGPLKDPFNRFIHLVFTLSNSKHLVMSDTRKFGKITVFDTDKENRHLQNIGPEPLAKDFTLEKLIGRLNKKSKGHRQSGVNKIKTVLMDQGVIAGIGNIYSDEILWRAGVNPERYVKTLIPQEFVLIHKAIKELLKKGIDFGGDSMSDYRNINGERGKFQLHHEAYRRTGEKCRKKGCKGAIQRKVINSRSAHFCDRHQR
ncbi:MAG: DNA-formamidopyrimidine glycosylase [Patescibacteria group bacterium]